MTDQRQSSSRPGRPSGRRTGPGAPAAGRGAVRVPQPPSRPGPRPAPAGAVPLLTHDAAGGHPTPSRSGPAAEGRGRVPFRSPAPAPGRRPPTARQPAGRPRRRNWIRRVFLALLALILIPPAAAVLIGWAVFDVPSANETAVTQVATFTYADGAPLATIRPDNVNRVIVPLDQVPEHVRQAVLAAEDRSFYSNPGFDLTGIARALWNQATGGVGGGSTITQQYVKVSTGQDSASILRKYKEIVLAVKISQQQSKDQILENYLNVIYLGRGAYGIQAASQAYFGKDVKDLSVSEGAMLAGIIQSPSRWDPAKNREKSQERWNFVLDGMAAQGWLPGLDRGLQRFPDFLPEPPALPGIPADSAGHLYTQAKAELETRGITAQEIDTEGLIVELTVDSNRQKQAVDAVNRILARQPDNLRAALVSVDPKTGAILAYYGGADGVGTDYAQALRQPGSSFKPFVLSAALQDPRQRVGLGSTYDGSSPQTFLGIPVANSEGVSCGQCSVQTAMTNSINTVFYKMAIDVGPARVADAAHQAGIPADELPNPTAGIALGDKEVRPVDMASAFATFAADGVRREPYLVRKVTTADGRILYEHGEPVGQPAVDPQVARNVTEAMKDVASTGRIAPAGGRPVAAKTGTVQHPELTGQNKDAWTVGYTPSASTAVWVGTDKSDPIRNAAGRPVFGRMLPGSIWQTYMSSALRGTPTEQFSRFVALGTPPINDDLDDESSDEESEGRSDEDDEDSDRSRDGDSDSDRSSNSDRGSDNSGNSSDRSTDDSEG